MENRLWSLAPFECENLPTSQLRQKWEEYKKSFMYVATAIAESDKLKLKKIFLAVAGRDLQKIYESIPDANDDKATDPLEHMLEELDKYFAPKRHDTLERFVFWSMAPNPEETLDKFLLRARAQATKCDFGTSMSDSQEIAVVDKILLLAPQELRRKILEKSTVDLAELTQIVNSHISIQNQARELNPSSSLAGSFLNASRSDNTLSVNKITAPGKRHTNQTWPRNARKNEIDCTRCGFEGHTESQSTCPARNVKCGKCNAIGHYARMCRSNEQRKRHFDQRASTSQPPYKKFRVNAVEEMEQIQNEPDEDDSDGFIYMISDNHDEVVWCNLGGTMVEMMIDSGSKYNVIGEDTWAYLKENGSKLMNQRATNKRLVAYGQDEPLQIECCFQATLSIEDDTENCSTDATFYVIRGGERTLLGRDSARELDVLVLGRKNVAGRMRHVQQIQEGKGVRAFPKIKGKLNIQIRLILPPANGRNLNY